MFDMILRNGLVVDGTGKKRCVADIAIEKARIAGIGDLKEYKVEKGIDVIGKMVVPGLIDPHSHADLSVLFEPSMTNYLMKGVTTVVGGNCGHSYGPVGDELYRSAIIDSRVALEADHPTLR